MRVNGTLLDGVDENRMRERAHGGDYLTLILTLLNDTWVEALGTQAVSVLTRERLLTVA